MIKEKKVEKLQQPERSNTAKKKKEEDNSSVLLKKKKELVVQLSEGGRESNLYLYIVGKACKFEGVALDDRYSAEMKRSETRGVIVLQKKKREQQQPAEINVMSRVKQRLGK